MKKSEIVFSLRMPENYHKKLKTISAKEQRSLNSQMLYYIQEGIDLYEKKYGTIPLKN